MLCPVGDDRVEDLPRELHLFIGREEAGLIEKRIEKRTVRKAKEEQS